MYVVTGAAGFIGSNLLAELEHRGKCTNIACDFLENGEKWNNLAKRNLYDYIPPERLFQALEQHKNHIEVIFHLGAISFTDATDGDLIMQHNFRLSMDLFEWCARNRVRFIYASSAATYGKGEHGFFDHEDLEYLSRLRPLNLYGWSKHLFDRATLQHASSKDSPSPPQWIGLKFFNVYGPNETHKGSQSSVIPHFYNQILEDQSVRLFKSYKEGIKDGCQVRDFISVQDAVDVMLWFSENPDKKSGLYNVGTGNPQTFLDLTHAVFKSMNQEPSLQFIEMPERLRKHYQYFTQASMEKLYNQGYTRSFLSIEEGVEDYIQNYLTKEDPYR